MPAVNGGGLFQNKKLTSRTQKLCMNASSAFIYQHSKPKYEQEKKFFHTCEVGIERSLVPMRQSVLFLVVLGNSILPMG